MSDFQKFLNSLGGLHDCEITQLRIDFRRREIEFQFDDLFSNFFGLPEYKGPLAGKIVLREIYKFDYKASNFPTSSLKVYDFICRESDDGQEANVAFWPEGSICVGFSFADFPDLKAL